ncbi:MAG: CoA transferase subunit A [Deltaproteobacteria bacterium]|nr:CoA transferase subunit A [Deltaproteobacteria bacterium]
MDVIEQGVGRIFTDPDADKAREFFRHKSRALVSKLTTVKEAVEKLVKDGDYLSIGGFGANRVAMSCVHEIVRQKKKNLGLAGHTATHDFQVLAAGECFNKCDVAYIVGLEARGLSANARKYMESGKVEVTEWTNYTLAARYKAATAGVSFHPIRNLMGTDTFKYSGAKMAKCPFTGTNYALVPALYSDVAIIHVHEADVYGNCRVRGILMSDYDVARSSKKVIITCERIIPTDEIRRDPTSTFIPYWCVDAVCEVPYGSYPGNMYGEYFSDEDHLREWLKVEQDPEEFKAFLDRNIYGVKDHFEYIERNGGIAKMLKLRQKEWLLVGARA